MKTEHASSNRSHHGHRKKAGCYRYPQQTYEVSRRFHGPPYVDRIHHIECQGSPPIEVFRPKARKPSTITVTAVSTEESMR